MLPHFLRPVVCAPRRLCAPSFVLLMASITACLLLAAPLAHPVRADAPASAFDVQRPAVSLNTSSLNISRTVHPNVSNPPYTVTLTGPTKDSSGNLNILVGQSCQATISLPPFVYGTTLTYQWKVSGTTFQSWSVVSDGNNQSHTTEVDGYGNPGAGSISWYWNDPSSTSESVSCTVTATAPAGQTNTSNGGSGTKSVSVQVPGFTFSATGGYIQINTNCPNQGGALDLYAGGLSGGSAGVIWDATCTTPPLFGKGSVELIQIATPNLSYTEYAGVMKVGPQHNDPQNGQTGLDGQCPYPGSSYTEGGPDFTSNDSPNAPLSNTIGSITMTHQFTDYLMYIPPGSSQVVPLATLTWGLNMTGSALIPSTANWADYAKQNGTDSAGTVTTTTKQATNKFPSWTLVNGPQPINSF